MAFDQTKFQVRFLEEAREHNSGLLESERNSGDAETMIALIRAAHSHKDQP